MPADTPLNLTAILLVCGAVALALAMGLALRHLRWRLGFHLAFLLARALEQVAPRQSLAASALALRWCLTDVGTAREPGQSVREHGIAATAGLPAFARKWFLDAIEIYCAARFGSRVATPDRARRMRRFLAQAAQTARQPAT